MSDRTRQLRRLIAPDAGGPVGRRRRAKPNPTGRTGVAMKGRPPVAGSTVLPPASLPIPTGPPSAAREATGGRVLGVQGAERNGQPGYRVRILEPSGRVRSLHFDPASGKMRD